MFPTMIPAFTFSFDLMQIDAPSNIASVHTDHRKPDDPFITISYCCCTLDSFDFDHHTVYWPGYYLPCLYRDCSASLYCCPYRSIMKKICETHIVDVRLDLVLMVMAKY